MVESRLYKLAYEALLNQWAKAYDFSKKYPESEYAYIKEKELEQELEELRREMIDKNIN
jgi:hypothetical protein